MALFAFHKIDRDNIFYSRRFCRYLQILVIILIINQQAFLHFVTRNFNWIVSGSGQTDVVDSNVCILLAKLSISRGSWPKSWEFKIKTI